MFFKKLSLIFLITFLLTFVQNSFADNSKKDKYFASSCYNYVHHRLSFDDTSILANPKPKVDISSSYSYGKLQKSVPTNNCNMNTLQFRSDYPEKCEYGYKISILLNITLPWGEKKKETYKCFLNELGETQSYW